MIDIWKLSKVNKICLKSGVLSPIFSLIWKLFDSEIKYCEGMFKKSYFKDLKFNKFLFLSALEDKFFITLYLLYNGPVT